MVRAAFVCFVAGTAAVLLPTAAFADDPRDPTMRNAEARARDSEATRQLNLQASAAVRQRGLRYEVRQRAVSAEGSYDADYAQYAAASRDHERDMDRYANMSGKWRTGTALLPPVARAITLLAIIEAHTLLDGISSTFVNRSLLVFRKPYATAKSMGRALSDGKNW